MTVKELKKQLKKFKDSDVVKVWGDMYESGEGVIVIDEKIIDIRIKK